VHVSHTAHMLLVQVLLLLQQSPETAVQHRMQPLNTAAAFSTAVAAAAAAARCDADPGLVQQAASVRELRLRAARYLVGQWKSWQDTAASLALLETLLAAGLPAEQVSPADAGGFGHSAVAQMHVCATLESKTCW